MSATTVTPAPKTSGDEIPWNKHQHQHLTPGDWVTSIIIYGLIALAVIAVLYPLWFLSLIHI